MHFQKATQIVHSSKPKNPLSSQKRHLFPQKDKDIIFFTKEMNSTRNQRTQSDKQTQNQQSEQ